jgi:hypothetical protein
VAALFPATAAPRLADKAGMGSTLAVPEVLSKPLRVGDAAAVTGLSQFLVRLDLRRSRSPTRPTCPNRTDAA